MSYKCDNCKKGILYGHNVSHSKRRTNRTWRPNLQWFRMKVDPTGNREKLRLCVKCLRIAKEEAKKMMQKETIANIKTPKVVPSASAI